MSTPILASTTGRYVTTCKLCRRDVAQTPALNIPLIGEPGKHTKDLIGLLGRHLAKFHPAEFEAGKHLTDLLNQEFIPFLILSTFHHQDPSVNPRLEVLRAPLFAVVRKNLMPDEDLKQIIAALGFSGDDDEKLLEAMRAVRDACCEFGQYAPQLPAPPPLVIPV
jgi:hypothetical protein